MIKGYNKAILNQHIDWFIKGSENAGFYSRPCVFLSHKREDKLHCKQIATYFRDVGVDYYLDEDDVNLESASASGNGKAVTECIKKGIRESTHMLVVVSEATYKSLWVPFEIGYGHAIILDEDKSADNLKLSVLTLKDLSEKALPDYLHTANVIRGTKSLNEYIQAISNASIRKSQVNELKLFSHSITTHPLDNILNWRL